LWIESRRLSPRTSYLGTDVLENKYWVFSSRKTKAREFGGWVVIQTPDNTSPTGAPNANSSDNAPEEDDEYSDLKSWYFVEKPEDIRQLAKWTMYLALKASAENERRKEKKAMASGSPNKLGQSFAVEVSSPIKMKERPGKGRKVIEFAGLVDTRILCEELEHAADWIEER